VTPAVGAGVAGVMQQTQQSAVVGPPPLELPSVDSGARADRQLDVVGDQVSEQAEYCSLAVKLLEDQPHHRLDLLIGIDERLTAG